MAFIFRRKGNKATESLHKTAEHQDVEGKGEVDLPAREMLADMLLKMNRPADALREFEKSLKTDPNRFQPALRRGQS
jgi:hypothetical protein